MVKKASKTSRKNHKIAIVVGQFNEFISQRLLDGCIGELTKKGIKKADISISWVPGSFEIPVAALKYAKKKNISAVICLGAVIKGETDHYELVTQGATYGIARCSLLTGKPVIFGVLACETVNQANARAEVNGDNKGVDAANAALDMIQVLSKI